MGIGRLCGKGGAWEEEVIREMGKVGLWLEGGAREEEVHGKVVCGNMRYMWNGGPW